MAAIVKENPNVDVVNSSVGATGFSPALNQGRIFINLKPRAERTTHLVTLATTTEIRCDYIVTGALLRAFTCSRLFSGGQDLPIHTGICSTISRP